IIINEEERVFDEAFRPKRRPIRSQWGSERAWRHLIPLERPDKITNGDRGHLLIGFRDEGLKMVVLDRNILRMERKITPNKKTITSRKFITVGSMESLGIKLRIAATRKNMKAEILEEIPTKQTTWSTTKHICNSRRMFVSYQKVNKSKPMFMGNETTSKIEEKGKVILNLTSGKDLVLSNVLHVPDIIKNLISGPILSNKGFKLVFESDKFVITKGGVYVGKGYLDEGLFKLSVVTNDNVINNNNASTSTASVYMIDPSFLWHSRLGHVNFCSLQRMINLGMLPKCSKDKISKCEICMES
nr:Pol polyprotein [Tanacetum cinerariifolium]